MKRPDPEQLQQLMMLRQYNKFFEYLDAVEYDYMENLISAVDMVEVHKLQGALSTIRRLREIISTTPKR